MSVPHQYRAAPLALLSPMTALTGNLNGPGHYIDWGPIQISLANLVMIAYRRGPVRPGAPAAVPEGKEAAMTSTRPPPTPRPGPVACASVSSARSPREAAARHPARVRRVVDLRLRRGHAGGIPRHPRRRAWSSPCTGPAWYHTSSLGHFVNSMHFWSVQLFFVFMVVHLWGKFWMAAWRGRRAMTWITGAVAFLGLDRNGVHRLPGADELRFAVDLLRRPRTGSTPSASARSSTCSNLGQMLLWHVCCCRSSSGCYRRVHVLMVRRAVWCRRSTPIDGRATDDRRS